MNQSETIQQEQEPEAAGPRELTEEEKALLAQSYDNEWIKFIKEIAKNQSRKDIVDYIEKNRWTDRQKTTIMAYAKVLLGDGLSTTYITDQRDYMMLFDDKALIDCDLTLGMTTFDLTPEFNILIGLINIHFGIEARKSKGGMFLKRIGTQRHEVIQEERIRETPGFKERIQEKVGW